MSALPLVDRLLAGLTSSGLVVDVRIGTHWTAVVVDRPSGPRAGLAATQMVHDLEHGRPAVRDAGKLIGRDARELAELARSDSLTERSIGFAALNALLDVDESACVDRNAEDLILERGPRADGRGGRSLSVCAEGARGCPDLLGLGAEPRPRRSARRAGAGDHPAGRRGGDHRHDAHQRHLRVAGGAAPARRFRGCAGPVDAVVAAAVRLRRRCHFRRCRCGHPCRARRDQPGRELPADSGQAIADDGPARRLP